MFKSILILFCGIGWAHSQNLIPNPSFEDTVNCPSSIGQLNRAKFWVNPTTSSPDYFNACSPNINWTNMPYTGFGFQTARTGQALAGIYTFNKPFPNVREYVQTKLSNTLTAGHKYLVGFYVCLSNGSQYSLSNIGAYFSSIAIASSNSVALSYSPQIQNNPTVQLSDTLNWMLVQDTLTSDGSEQYITIGNFKQDNQSDTVFRGSFGGNNIAYYYIDDVSVIDVLSLGLQKNSELSHVIYPNPATNILNIKFPSANAELRISDVLGNQVHREIFFYTTQVNVLDLSPGVYFITFNTNGQTVTEKFVKE